MVDVKLNVVDLFCGAGGISEGFREAGYNIVLGIDKDKKSVKTFDKNFDAKTLCRDIREIEPRELSDIIDSEEVGVVVGGPPCKGFSHARASRRDPDDPRNSLFEEFIRLIEYLEPEAVMMENVPGILTMETVHGEKVTRVIERKLDSLGFVVDYKKLNAADYGVPQKRKRVIFIASPDPSVIRFPEPTHSNHPMQKLNGDKLERWRGAGEVLFDRDGVEDVYFLSQKMIDGFRERKKRNEERGYGFGWQHLDPEEPSYTISARYYKDGSDALVKYSDDEIRMLTERECARIQTFPDDFEFHGGKKATYQQIGNAVPPLLAQRVAESLARVMDCSGDPSGS